MRAVILFVSLFLGQAAVAQTLEENVRAALVAADPDQLEALIDAAQTKALATGNHDEIRAVYRRIFATTHPDYQAVIEDWVTQYPASAYAWTALGDMQFWQALAHRVCYCYMPGGPKPLGDGFAALLPEAQLSALRAHNLDPAFVRATVLALKSYLYGEWGFAIDDVAEATLKVAPDRRVVLEAATSRAGLGHNSFAEAYAVCAKYAPYITGYSADNCAIEVALTTNAGWDAQEAAREAVLADPSPLFDHLRVRVARQRQPSPEQVQALMDIHFAQLSEVSDLNVWLEDVAFLNFATTNPFYLPEARERAIAEGLKRLNDDPRNPWLALMVIENLAFDPSLPPEGAPGQATANRVNAMHARAKALWRAALPFGYQSGHYWVAGMSADVDLYADRPSGVLAAIPYVENALILSNHGEYEISQLFTKYVWAAYGSWVYDRKTDTSGFATTDGTVLPEEVRCTVGRLARMMEFVCPLGAPYMAQSCQNGQPGDELKDILLKLEQPDYCPSVAAMSPSQLAYTELRAVPGFDPATYAGPATAP